MKLYSFEFKKKGIVRHEVEAHETPQCYVADEDLQPLNIKRISKGYIGIANRYLDPYVIIFEDDVEKAKRIMIESYEKRITGMKKAIYELETEIENIKKSSL